MLSAGKIAPMPLTKLVTTVVLFATFLASCAPAPTQVIYPTYDPFLPIQSGSTTGQPSTSETASNSPQAPTATRQPTPTRAPLSITPVFPLMAGVASQILGTPTPDQARILPTPRQESDEYVVQAGDTLGDIAQRYGISMQDLMLANNITDPNALDIGMVLKVPAPNPGAIGLSLKVIPDSELVYGPGSVYFNIGDFIQSQNGYLAAYTQDVNGEVLSSADIIQLVSENYSINPRLLLALLEYQSGWVTNPTPFNTSFPMGLADDNRYGLYRQLGWAADTLNRGYYLWKANALSTWVLTDGTVIPIDPTINAGTAAVQYFFSKFDDRATWEKDINETGMIVTYFVFFGNPFNYAVEPLVPPTLSQPAMQLPFGPNESWYFTGGPHGGWDAGSAWAALDFAPPGDNGSCFTSASWATAMADGLIIRASGGAVIQDLDNDGYEQTGWVILYMHIAAEERVNPGEYLFAGENVGHPSCEGGVSNATHVHIARKFNGQWISADGSIPFNLNGWVSSGDGIEYNGFLSRGSQTIEAWDSANGLNLISH